MDHNDAPQPEPPAPSAAAGTDLPQVYRPSRLHRTFLNERELRCGWRLFIYVVLWALIYGGFIALFGRPQMGGGLTDRLLLVSESEMLAAALIAAAIMGYIEKRTFADYALPWRSAFKSHFWQGVLWGGIGIVGLLLLIKAGHGFSFGPVNGKLGIPLLGVAALWAAGSLLTGIYEEFFLRGYALFTLTTGLGFWPAAVILSIVFGCLHLGNPGEDWPGIAAAMLIGLFFCFTLRRTGSLWLAIGFHAIWDFCENFVFMVPDSGIMTNSHLFRSSLHGSRWITGGSAGPEGSLFVFAVIGGLFVLIHFLYPDARFGLRAPQAVRNELEATAGAN